MSKLSKLKREAASNGTAHIGNPVAHNGQSLETQEDSLETIIFSYPAKCPLPLVFVSFRFYFLILRPLFHMNAAAEKFVLLTEKTGFTVLGYKGSAQGQIFLSYLTTKA